MIPKPSHLGAEYAAVFKDERVVEAYSFRPPYPIELFDILVGLIKGERERILDAGCGSGKIARQLAGRVEHVDAVDFSAAMIRRGKGLGGGDRRNLRWIHGPMETVELSPPYGLVTAAQSLHWMDWDVVMPRFFDVLVRGGYLAIVSNTPSKMDWDEEIIPIIQRYSTNQEFQPYDLVEELEKRDLFEAVGKSQTAPMANTQSVDAFVESWHSGNGLSRERMSQEAADGFDREVKEMVSSHIEDDQFEMHFTGQVIWGWPRHVPGNR